jgi:ABC-2 type transport system ATP-binding protein
MTIAISFAEVCKHYGTLQALKDITFDIAEGCFFGLLGPNGAGKSTLINITAGLTHASTGTVKIMGHEVRKQSASASGVRGSASRIGV